MKALLLILLIAVGGCSTPKPKPKPEPEPKIYRMNRELRVSDYHKDLIMQFIWMRLNDCNSTGRAK